MTLKQIVKREWPDAVCYRLSAREPWAVYVNGQNGAVVLGRANTPANAWNAARVAFCGLASDYSRA